MSAVSTCWNSFGDNDLTLHQTWSLRLSNLLFHNSYEVEGCEVVWAIKDESISHTFVDAGAAQFFLPQLSADKQLAEGPSKRRKYTTEGSWGSRGAQFHHFRSFLFSGTQSKPPFITVSVMFANLHQSVLFDCVEEH